MNYDVFEIVKMVLISTLFVGLITPFIKKIAIHIGALDIPDKRKVHTEPIPRLGGLGVFLGLLLGYMLFGKQSILMNAILIASFIIVITGMIDDIKPISAKTKFLGQIAAACIIVFYGNLLLKDMNFWGINLDFGILAYPITIFFILGCINCINLIDGLDGLSSGISGIYFLTIGIITTIKGNNDLAFVLCFVMLGCCIGFLFHNFNPAKIFIGDSGSMLLGLIISVVALLGFKTTTLSSLIIPLLVLAIPILDTLFAIIRRKLKGESISKPDKFHIHHQLLNMNFNQRQTVIIIYIVDALFAAASIIYALGNPKFGYIIYGILLLIIVMFVSKTNVVVEHKTNIFDKINDKLFSKIKPVSKD